MNEVDAAAAGGAVELSVDVLLFEIGDRRYGTDASTILRIGQAEEASLELPELGPLDHGTRTLVFRSPRQADGEAQLRVDKVHGVRTIPQLQLRRLPKPAAVRSYALGVWLDGEVPVLLIDLPNSLNFTRVSEAT